MSRILAIDYGKRRVGIAVTDPMQMIASALATVDEKESIDFLKDYCTREEVEAVVVGQPKRWSGELSQVEADILIFIQKLGEAVPGIRIDRYDERFTSKMAKASLLESGVKKKGRRDKSQLDSISATLILQDYLASRI